MNVLVLGIGNILLKDEGVGVRLIEAVDQEFVIPEGVELLDGGTAGIELLDHISQRELLVIVDAMRNGHPAGTVYRVGSHRDTPKIHALACRPGQSRIRLPHVTAGTSPYR